MAWRMHAVIAVCSDRDSRGAEPPFARTGGTDRLLRFTIHVVFGTPFIGSAVLLVRMNRTREE